MQLPANSFQRAGYIFIGWSEDPMPSNRNIRTDRRSILSAMQDRPMNCMPSGRRLTDRSICTTLFVMMRCSKGMSRFKVEIKQDSAGIILIPSMDVSIRTTNQDILRTVINKGGRDEKYIEMILRKISCQYACPPDSNDNLFQ